MTDEQKQSELDYWRELLAADPDVKVPFDVALEAEAEDDGEGS